MSEYSAYGAEFQFQRASHLAAGEQGDEGSRIDSRSRNESGSDWQRAHQQLTRLARSRAGLDFEEGRWLVAAWRGGVHMRLGYGSFSEYIERLFGYGHRLTQEKLRVAQALEVLPAMAEALHGGEAPWSMLRELTRVATPETEADTSRRGPTEADMIQTT